MTDELDTGLGFRVPGAAVRAAAVTAGAAWCLADALVTTHPEAWWNQVERVIAGEDARRVALEYVSRNRGLRPDVIAELLRRAANGLQDAKEARPDAGTAHHRGRASSSMYVVARAAFVEGEPEPGDPRYRMRAEAVDGLMRGARRVAHRGAGICTACGKEKACAGLEVCRRCDETRLERRNNRDDRHEEELWRKAEAGILSPAGGSREHRRRIRRLRS